MLDLKKQLLQAGLVTEQQVEKVEQEEAEAREKKRQRRAAQKAREKGGPAKGGKGKGKGPRKGKGGGRGKGKGNPEAAEGKDRPDDATLWARRIEKLAQEGRTEQYEVIRKWVDKTRLDKAGELPSEKAERFFFEKGDKQVGWLTVEPDLIEKLKAGQAGVIAYVGFNGMNHCAVPRDVCIDVHKVRPEFLRALADYEFALLPILTGKDRRKKERADKQPDEEGAAPDAAQADATTTDTPAADAPVADAPVADAPTASAQPGGDAAAQDGPSAPTTQAPPDPSASSQ